jgi:hypothetical protein
MSSGPQDHENEYVLGQPTISLPPFLPPSPLRIFRTAFPATTLATIAPTRRVKKATGTHYSNLEFTVEDVRGLGSIFIGTVR